MPDPFPETFETRVTALANHADALIDRFGAIETDDLIDLGWSRPELADLLPEALRLVGRWRGATIPEDATTLPELA